jgi:L-ascorbate metabolism protein UlaG (beta-lactamase superfamily)
MQTRGIDIQFLGHSGFLISTETKKIAIDPYNISDKVPQVDLILITHSHYDHCSIKDIEKISKEGTIAIVTADSQSKITKVKNLEIQIIESGDEIKFGSLKVEAIPAYNIDKEFHPKREGWLGFILKFKDTIVYHAGDTDKIPEMQNLTGYGKHGNEFIVLLPVSGKYVMDPEEAAEIASLLSPDLVIPMHYGAGVAGTIEDAKRFISLCQRVGLKAQILEKV